jgi:predicted dehydrogenase/threonine dehydrogenase-like Zn-dependent dehydrogenase
MRQILQSLKNGDIQLVDIPSPIQQDGQLLIQSACSLLSAGTERMLIDFGKASLAGKARSQPEKVKEVVNKFNTDGIFATLDAVNNKLDQPIPLGYSNVGEVIGVGKGVSGFSVGDRVVSNGPHAEVVSVPLNLCAKIPGNVSYSEASFTVLGAVALQGIRLIKPTLGEAIVVTGLGLVGLLTVQLLKANGCRVLGIDPDPIRSELARSFGAEIVRLVDGEDPLLKAVEFSRGRGVDGVVVTATTESSNPIHQAAQMCRQRGRIVLVGVTGLKLSRADFYKKELTFQVSSSYGPGRYDEDYEVKGRDYPIGFVRWTEQRNFEAVLDMMAAGKLDVNPFITHRFLFTEAARAYDLLSSKENSLGIVLDYSTLPLDRLERNKSVEPAKNDGIQKQRVGGNISIGFIGAGNYSRAVLIPAFKAAGADLRYIASLNGLSGHHAGKKFGFTKISTNTSEVLNDPDTDALIITTRHDSHAQFVIKGLESKKHIFVEKPLCLTLEELVEIESVYSKQATLTNDAPILMVGFNRRFSPHVVKIKSLLRATSGSKSFVLTVNAGAISSEHWTQSLLIGGGRIVGEACHFIDLLRFLAGSNIESWSCETMAAECPDTTTINLKFVDGSIGTIHYFANGSKAFPKEQLLVFSAGRVLRLENFRQLVGFGWPSFKKQKTWRQEKGQKKCTAAFIKAVAYAQESPIPPEEIFEVSRVAIEIGAKLNHG